MLNFEMLHPRMTEEALGEIPYFLSPLDERAAKHQIDTAYQHGGGWRPIGGYELEADDTLCYPGDPPLQPLAKAKLRDETILFYRHAIVAIVHPNRSFEAARVD